VRVCVSGQSAVAKGAKRGGHVRQTNISRRKVYEKTQATVETVDRKRSDAVWRTLENKIKNRSPQTIKCVRLLRVDGARVIGR